MNEPGRLTASSVKLKVLKYTSLGALALFAAFRLLVYLGWRGHIPSFADTQDVSYEKQLGIQPSSGRVWQYAAGWGSGIGYYRLHLSRSAFEASGIPKLTRQSGFKKTSSAPIWWNPSSDVALCFTSGGIGYQTQNLYVFDTRRELLFARCEWN